MTGSALTITSVLFLIFLSIGHVEGMEAHDEDEAEGRAHDASMLHSTSTVAGFHIELMVEPATVEPGIPVRFSHRFMDSVTGELKETVPHTFVILKDGSVIFQEYAEDSGRIHEFMFSEEHKGPLTIMIKDVNNTGNDAEFSITVVPEFPTTLVTLIGATASALLLARIRGLNPWS